MADIILMKAPGDILVPHDDEAKEFIKKVKLGGLVHADFKKMRNYEFHKKYFALVNFAYENWEPGVVEFKGVVIAKNLDRFRKDLIIMAGFHEATFTIKGDVRYEPKSISFASMDEIEFEKLYSKTIDIVLGKILTGYTKSDLENVIEQLMQFTWSGR